MEIVDYIYDECHRQHVTNYGDFATAWQFMKDRTAPTNADHLGQLVMSLARKVEPELNAYVQIDNNLRSSHVGFMHGGNAAPAGEVRKHFNRWCNNLFFEMNDFREKSIQHYIDSDEQLADMWIKTLLDIHPWADGNGRTASILRNWMLGTLDDPTPLPHYYGES